MIKLKIKLIYLPAMLVAVFMIFFVNANTARASYYVGSDTDGSSDGYYNLRIDGDESDIHWIGNTSVDWHNPANWFGNQLPQACSTVILDATGTYQPTIDFTQVASGTSFSIANLTIGTSTGANVTTLTMKHFTPDSSLKVGGDVVVNAKGVLTHTAHITADANTHKHSINIEADSIIIHYTDSANYGKIDINGKGFAKGYGPGIGGGYGSSHGGVGVSDGPTYGLITEPALLGSGGSGRFGTGSGGGAVKLKANDLVINGSILNNGLNHGSGGSIWLNAVDNLNLGTSSIIFAGSTYASGSGPGGGRIAIYYTESNTESRLYDNNRVYASSPQAGAGTIYIKKAGSTNGDLIVDGKNGNSYNKNTPIYNNLGGEQFQNSTFDNVHVRGKAILQLNDNSTMKIVDKLDGNAASRGTVQIDSGSELELADDKNYHNNVNINNYGIFKYVNATGTFELISANFTNQSTGKLCRNNCSSDTDYITELKIGPSSSGNAQFTDFNGSIIDGENGGSLVNLKINSTGIYSMGNYLEPANFNSVYVYAGGTLTHEAHTAADANTQKHSLNIEANNITIDSGGLINLNVKGFYNNYGPGGGDGYSSYGGLGVSSRPTYGSITEPTDLGSGSQYSIGGGAVKLQANNLIVNGEITSEAYNASGGSIWLSSSNLSIGPSAVLKANNTLNGGGGRIAVYYDNADENSRLRLYDNTRVYASSHWSGAGTIYIKQASSTNGDLIVDGKNGNTNNKATPIYNNLGGEQFQNTTFDNVYVKNRGILQLNDNSTMKIFDKLDGNAASRGTVQIDSGSELEILDATNKANNLNISNYGNFKFNLATSTLEITNVYFTDFNGSTVQGEVSKANLDLTIGNGGIYSLGNYLETVNFKNVDVYDGGTLTHEAHTATDGNTQKHSINIEANDITIATSGKINLDNKGFYDQYGPGGGAYASYGGVGFSNIPTYGSITEPTDLGSGSQYQIGGGAVKLQANNLIVNGEITSEARDASGGSIWLSSSNLSIGFSAVLKANNTQNGGGGRIAVYYDNADENSRLRLYDNTRVYASSNWSGAGTIYIKQASSTNGDLIVDGKNGNTNNKATPIYNNLGGTIESSFDNVYVRNKGILLINPEATLNFSGSSVANGAGYSATSYIDNQGTIKVATSGLEMTNLYIKQYPGSKLVDVNGNPGNLTIGNGMVLEMNGYLTPDTSYLQFGDLTIKNGGKITHVQNTTALNHSVYLRADNINIENGGLIDVQGRGYNSAEVGQPGAGHSGAGHGGIGGAAGGLGGGSYDSMYEPNEVGSKGAGIVTTSGFGGGLVRLIVDDTFTNNGIINANANNGTADNGGGSGGGILISATDIAGGGSLYAKGGIGSGNSGGGAGGRIAMFYVYDGDYYGSRTASTSDYMGGLGYDSGSSDDDGEIGTFYMGSPTHYEITGTSTQTVGISQTITVHIKDDSRNAFPYDGDNIVWFTGADVSPSGKEGTITDKYGNVINFGEPTILNFTSGQATTNMTLYAVGSQEIDVRNGHYDSYDDPDYDLNVNVISNPNPIIIPNEENEASPYFEISATPNPTSLSAASTTTVTITAYDGVGNRITSGGSDIEASIVGANPGEYSTATTTPSNLITDNNDGTYTFDFTNHNTGTSTITAVQAGEIVSDGSDGSLTVNSLNTVINDYAYLTANAESVSQITVNATSSFSVGDEIFIIQMQYSSNAGIYEYATINNISGNTITLSNTLTNNYYSGTFNNINSSVTQIVRVPQYTSLSVNSGASITAPAWDGYTGGIVIFKAQNDVNVAGIIDVSSKGFRGGDKSIGSNRTTQSGKQGESFSGIGAMIRDANNGAGGGGQFNTNGGGGGGYGTAGANGGSYDGYFGYGGNVYGDSELNNIYFGSGGGGGGYSNNVGGDGGKGGGVVIINATAIDINGTITVAGQTGFNGVSNGAGGGGGSGGSIYLRAASIDTSGSLIGVNGGAGGISPGGYRAGGIGGNGRTLSKIDLNIGNNPITRDTDGIVSDGIFHHLTVVEASVHHLEVSDNLYAQASAPVTVVAGATTTVYVRAKDSSRTDYSPYQANKNMVFSGPGNAASGEVPQFKGSGLFVNRGLNTPRYFIQGRGGFDMALYKAESVKINASDGSIDSTGSGAYGFDVVVVPAVASGVRSTSTPDKRVYGFYPGETATSTVTVYARDRYDNPISGGALSIGVSGANSRVYSGGDITELGNGYYSFKHVAANAGDDIFNISVSSNGQSAFIRPMNLNFYYFIDGNCRPVVPMKFTSDPDSVEHKTILCADGSPIEITKMIPGDEWVPWIYRCQSINFGATSTTCMAHRPDDEIDYRGSGNTIEVAATTSNTAIFPNYRIRAIMNSGQKLDLSDAVGAGNSNDSYDGTTVGSALTSLKGSGVSSVSKVSIANGQYAEAGTMEIYNPFDNIRVSFQDNTIIYGEAGVWDESILAPNDITDELAVSGFIANQVVRVGSVNEPLVFSEAALVQLSAEEGTPLYSTDGNDWQEISLCADATINSPGSLTFPNECYFKQDQKTYVWTYHFTDFGTFSVDPALTFNSLFSGQAPGEITLAFTPVMTIPAGGSIELTIPSGFIATDIADLTSSITTFTASGTNPGITSSNLTDNVITIVNTAQINAFEPVIIVFNNTVIDTNPVIMGRYTFNLDIYDNLSVLQDYGNIDIDLVARFMADLTADANYNDGLADGEGLDDYGLVTSEPEVDANSTNDVYFSQFNRYGNFLASDSVTITVPTGWSVENCGAATTDVDADGTVDGSMSFTSSNIALYTFSSPTTLATSTGLEFCLSVTSDNNPGNEVVTITSSSTMPETGAVFIYNSQRNEVTVTADFYDSLYFQIRDLADANPTNVCDLGILSIGQVKECSYRLAVETNAADGFSLFIDDISINSGLTANLGTDNIDPITESQVVTAGQEGYGISLANATSIIKQGDFINNDAAIPTTKKAIMLATTPYDWQQGTTTTSSLVTHRAAISATTAEGNYTQTVAYYITANY